jgi:mannosyltransferase
VHNVEPNNILYFGFLHFWEKLGSSDEFLRLPSVLAFPAAVALTATIAWRSFGRAAGVVAGFLLALNALALQHGQEARAYGSLTALVAASMLCFMLVVERPTTRRWALWAAVSVVAAYLHPYALFVVAAQGLSLAWLPSARVHWRAAGIASAVLALAVLPLIVLVVTGDTSRISWIDPLTAASAWGELKQVAGAREQALLLLVYIGLALVLLVGALRTRPRRSEAAWLAVLPVLWFAVPVALTALLSVVQPTFLAKYLIVSVPALAVLAAGALARVRPLPLAVAALVALAIFHVGGLSDWYRSRGPDLHGAAAVIAPRARWDETIVTDPSGNSSLAWYLGRPAEVPSPGSVRRAEGIDPGPEQAALRAQPRVWLVQTGVGNNFDNRVPRQVLGARRVLRAWELHNVRIALLGRPGDSGD